MSLILTNPFSQTQARTVKLLFPSLQLSPNFKQQSTWVLTENEGERDNIWFQNYFHAFLTYNDGFTFAELGDENQNGRIQIEIMTLGMTSLWKHYARKRHKRAFSRNVHTHMHVYTHTHTYTTPHTHTCTHAHNTHTTHTYHTNNTHARTHTHICAKPTSGAECGHADCPCWHTAESCPASHTLESFSTRDLLYPLGSTLGKLYTRETGRDRLPPTRAWSGLWTWTPHASERVRQGAWEWRVQEPKETRGSEGTPMPWSVSMKAQTVGQTLVWKQVHGARPLPRGQLINELDRRNSGKDAMKAMPIQ